MPHTSYLTSIINLILPPLCLSCRVPVAMVHAVCGTCWQNLRFIAEPCCACCGLPFDVDYGGDTLCAGCLADPPPYETARAALVYDEVSKPLILALKHGDQWQGVPAFGQWLRRLVPDNDIDYVAPVPLHWTRLWRRKYNQAALLSGIIARMGMGIHKPDLLQRKRATPSQGSLRRKGRFRNVTGAFAVKNNHLLALQGRKILLVDDVMTTGATLKECTKVILRAGAASVKVVTLARVL